MDVTTAQTVAGLSASAIGFAVAAVVLFVAPGRTQNRFLATALLFESTAMLTIGAFPLAADPATFYALFSLNILMAPLVAIFYLGFLGTLDSPLAWPLAPAPVRAALAVGGAALLLTWPAIYPIDVRLALWPLAGVMLFGIAVAATSLTRAQTVLARRRAKMFLAAFGLRDAVTMTLLLGLAPSPQYYGLLFAVSSLASFVVLGYATLVLELFDVDLKVRWTLKQGTVAAAFLATFFIVSEVAAILIAEAAGPILGVIGAGLLMFFLAPLQAAAERIASHAMPATRPTADYVAFRKLEVYKTAVEEVMIDGVLSPKERRTLDRLREKLGIAASDAIALERDHATRLPEAPSES